MKQQRGEARAANRSQPKRRPVRSKASGWWPYAIAAAAIVLVVAFIAVMRLGQTPVGSQGVSGERLAVGSSVPTDSVPSSSGDMVSLADFRGSKVVVYFYEGGR